MSQTKLTVVSPGSGGPKLTEAILAAMVDFSADRYEYHRTAATAYLDDDGAVRAMKNIFTLGDDELVADGVRVGEVIDGRFAVQIDVKNGTSDAMRRLTHHRVAALGAAPAVAQVASGV